MVFLSLFGSEGGEGCRIIIHSSFLLGLIYWFCEAAVGTLPVFYAGKLTFIYIIEPCVCICVCMCVSKDKRIKGE